MNKIQDAYFAWLGKRVDPTAQYSHLNSYIHAGWDFRWTIAIDKNRQIDGYYLREDFLKTCCDVDNAYSELSDFEFQPVSVFEVLVALVSRMDYELDDLSGVTRFEVWYKELLTNLDLVGLTDDVWKCNVIHAKAIVWEVMTKLLDRTYDRNGVGGLFPLKNAPQDLRTVEIWYQMMIYLNAR